MSFAPLQVALPEGVGLLAVGVIGVKDGCATFVRCDGLRRRA
jgi:hypothetical protein